MWIGVCWCPQSSAFQDETAISIRAPDSAGHLLDLLPVQSNNLHTAVNCPCPKHKGKFRNHGESALGFADCLGLEKYKVWQRDQCRRFDFSPWKPTFRHWCSSSLTGTKRETRSSLRRTRKKRKSTAAKRRLPARLRQLSQPPPGSPSTRCWWSMSSSGMFAQDPE